MEHVLPDKPLPGMTMVSKIHYSNLLASIDGIISPFSTMILEGALCGKPSFCVAFSDEVNKWDFAEVHNAEHIKKIANRCWIDVCKSSIELEMKFGLFLNKLGRSQAVESILNDIKSTIFVDEEPYSDRLCRCINEDFLYSNKLSH
jgi:hypothetical protein